MVPNLQLHSTRSARGLAFATGTLHPIIAQWTCQQQAFKQPNNFYLQQKKLSCPDSTLNGLFDWSIAVYREDANISQNQLSILTPVELAALGARTGDEVRYEIFNHLY